jgi:ATP-independent RNA helicase DbpA
LQTAKEHTVILDHSTDHSPDHAVEHSLEEFSEHPPLPVLPEVPFPAPCLALLAALGFTHPTPVQLAAIPALAAGETVHALAPTGSGKTLAFLIPLMLRIDAEPARTRLLILAPTRELGAQIARVAEGVAERLRAHDGRSLRVRTAFGGQRADTQKLELQKNPHIVVATPGRALDCLRTEALDLHGLDAVVLDEADLMLSMGFGGQMESLFRKLPSGLQTALFSATESALPGALENRLLRDARNIDVREETPKERTHELLRVANAGERHRRLAEALHAIEGDVPFGLIFCQTREGVHALTAYFKSQGLSAEALSGELGQIQRDSILRRFKAGALRWLVATNIAARGIDVSALPLVVNFDLPSTLAEYVHRAGRTGRAGRSARVLNVCPPGSETFLRALVKDEGITLRQLPKIATTLVEEAQTPSTPSAPPVSFRTLHLNRGKSDKVRAGDVVGALTQQVGLAKEDIGGIFIFDHFTHVEVSTKQVSAVLSTLPKSRVKNLTVKVSEANV